MSIFKLFPTQKAKKFVYNPVYYDERKERLQKMIEEAENEASGVSREVGQNRLEHGFIKANLRKSKFKRQDQRGSVLKMVLAVIVLLILFYLLLFWF